MRFAPFLCAIVSVTAPAAAADWQSLDAAAIAVLRDDDLDRHRANAAFLDGIAVSEIRFSENGFDWHLIRFTSETKPHGPLWVAPHDDENAAFEAMITALKRHGGVAVAVNSGPGSARRQAGYGVCGVKAAKASSCDPNRNFDARAPLFTGTILSQLPQGQPIIALHANSPGFSGDGKGGRGGITMLDAAAYARGETRVRADGYFGTKGIAVLDDPDVYAILPYRASIGAGDVQCRTALNAAGINVWHERVGRSDGSLSNYIALNRPDVAYVNFEVKYESDLSIGAEAQRLMIDSYLAQCAALWNKPAPGPVAGR